MLCCVGSQSPRDGRKPRHGRESSGKHGRSSSGRRGSQTSQRSSRSRRNSATSRNTSTSKIIVPGPQNDASKNMINSEPLDVLLERDEVGRTLAHQWAAEGKYKELRDLHARGIDLNIADRDGVTPVHRAAECNKWNVIQVLAQLDVDLSVRDICAQTPQHYGITTRTYSAFFMN